MSDIFKFYNIDDSLGTMLKYRDFEITACCHDVVDVLKNYVINNINEEGIIVEIGVQGGASFLKMADVILTTNKNIKLYGIDCWEEQCKIGFNGHPESFWTQESVNRLKNIQIKNFNTLLLIIQTYNLDFCNLIKGFSSDIAIINKFNNNSIDAIYIDGDHGFEGCYLDLVNYYPKIKTNGIIMCDDYTNFHSVKAAVDKFCEEKKINQLFVENKCYFYKK
jgi:predicted O-methyltransferase YrrM